MWCLRYNLLIFLRHPHSQPVGCLHVYVLDACEPCDRSGDFESRLCAAVLLFAASCTSHDAKYVEPQLHTHVSLFWVKEPRDRVYPLVAAVQQDPHGTPAFLHRVTPGAKYDPTRNEFLEVDYITTPLR